MLSKKNTFKFCFNEKRITFKDVDQYYKLSNVESGSFPYINKGNDTVILKIDEYSITQYFGK